MKGNFINPCPGTINNRNSVRLNNVSVFRAYRLLSIGTERQSCTKTFVPQHKSCEFTSKPKHLYKTKAAQLPSRALLGVTLAKVLQIFNEVSLLQVYPHCQGDGKICCSTVTCELSISVPHTSFCFVFFFQRLTRPFLFLFPSHQHRHAFHAFFLSFLLFLCRPLLWCVKGRRQITGKKIKMFHSGDTPLCILSVDCRYGIIVSNSL